MNSSDFGQLLIFHSIAQENSISGAAKRLGIAVPSVSKSLKNLEKQIGFNAAPAACSSPKRA